MTNIFSLHSLRRRILFATVGTIIFFLLLAGVALDKAFQRTIRNNIASQLQTQTFSLLALAEKNEQRQFEIPSALIPSDMVIPESGLYALIINHLGNIIWRSPSALGEIFPSLEPMSAGASDFVHNKYNNKLPFIYRFGSAWESEQNTDDFLTFILVQNKSSYLRQIKNYQETLFQWLGGGALFILLIQGWIVIWQLRPLKRVVTEIDAIEQGKSHQISGHYPTELAILTRRINQFIVNERTQLKRYRNGLDDLAHSLKTPLAVIRSLKLNNHKADHQDIQLNEQISRMCEIIDYQLKRATSSGTNTLGAKSTLIFPVIEKTLHALDKVYKDKSISYHIDCAKNLHFRGDKDDLYEIIGNLCDNAFKWAQSTVWVKVTNADEQINACATITIKDDGAGFSNQSKQQLTQRGVRADEQMPGQGIGLAVVQNIVQAYQGTLRIDNHAKGGALIEINFPLALIQAQQN